MESDYDYPEREFKLDKSREFRPGNFDTVEDQLSMAIRCAPSALGK